MASPASPAETRKPASPPPAKAGKPAGEKAPGGKATDQAKAGAPSTAGKLPAGTAGKQPAGDKGQASSGQQRFDRMAVRAKLAVSQPGDRVEHEADAVADKVMRMPAPDQTRSGGADKATATPAATPPASAGQKVAPPRPEDTVKRKEDSTGKPAAVPETFDPQALADRLGPGQPLDHAVRTWFEARLSCDLSRVRIHTDANAAQAAQQLAARAFTFGNHIAFAVGQYQPDSPAGQRLLAHELAHVLQQRDDLVPRLIMRKPAGGDGTTSDEFQINKNALQIPPIKARHTGAYRLLAKAGKLKRKGGYDASKRGTKQVSIWLDGAKPDIDKIPVARRPSASAGWNLNLNVKGGVSSKVVPAKSQEELERLLKIPTWDGDGKDETYQVDHMVEYQLGGADALENMELLNQAYNGSVGSSFAHAITQVVNAEIRDDPGNKALTGLGASPSAATVMDARTVVFKKVEGRARDSKRKEGGSTFWSLQQIDALDHVLPMLGDAGKLTGSATRFALLSPTGNLLIAHFPHGAKTNRIPVAGNLSGGIAGFKISHLALNSGYNDAALGAEIGSLEGTLNFGPSVKIPKDQKVSVGISQATHPGTYSGRLGKAAAAGMPSEVDFKPMSPLDLSDITLGKGLYGKAMLRPSHPALAGVKIPAQISDGRLGLYYSLDAGALAGRLKIPGVKIDSASVDFGYDGEVFSVGGGVEFTIQKFGTGWLDARTDSRGDFSLEGGLRADTRLFDKADMRLWYRSKGGFGGSGRLEITHPGKIKGIKSARVDAKYEDSVFSASGDVIPDIPGLKAASLTVLYEKDALQITGQLAIDDKVPGVEAANITVSVTQEADRWKVGASGQVTPKLPGLAGAQLTFAYDDGMVLLEGEFKINKGPLDGTVKAGVTNAAVDEKGVRAAKGEGHTFTVFGAADINAVFIKDKLAGKLKLRLLPDGSVRVGGGLVVADFELFGPIPKDGGVFFDEPFSTPPIPIPGLGFSVGSVSVGVTFSASINPKLYAYIGPGKLTGITIEVTEFDPATVNFDTLEIGGGAKFQVYGGAGFDLIAKLTLEFSAAVASLEGSVGVGAGVGIPKDKPVLDMASKFTYSELNGLAIVGILNLDISPELKFRLFGEVAAKLNLLIKKVTVWSKDFTLAEANYKLPIGVQASGALGYNTKTGQLTPPKPQDAIKIGKPKIDADTLLSVVKGDSRPPDVKTKDHNGQELSQEDAMMCTPVGDPFAANQSVMSSEPNQSVMPSEPNQSVMPKRSGDGKTPDSVDTDLVHRLGLGQPLATETRGWFEQRLGIDLGRVRIHVNPAAAREAQRLGARAFTVGEHIAFARGEFQPDSPDGQELIAHELAHIAQQQGDTGVVLRWPAVTRTPARTSETPATIRAMSLAEFISLTHTQPDWATSPALQADAAALPQFRTIQGFADGPGVVESCGDLNMADIIARGVPGIFPVLNKYRDGVTSGATAWLRRTNRVDDAQRWGTGLTHLEAVWPAANLSLVMRAPDPVSNPSPFEKLTPAAAPELPSFMTYLTACTPVLSAENGAEVDSFLALRAEGATPASYLGTVRHVRNYHHFTKNTLDGLAGNEAFPQWEQALSWTRRPLTVVLYPAVDHNGAFHRNAGLEAMVLDNDILTIVVEGLAHVADYQAQLAPVAARYGVGGRIQQAMVAGHGNATVLALAGTAGATVSGDDLGTSGTTGANTTSLMTELTRLMSSDPAKRRIILDACLTNSHHVATALRASPADAAADVNAAIAADPSLRDVVAGIAGGGATVLGSSSSFAPGQTTFIRPGSSQLGLSVPDDPDLTADKLTYVEFGTEPEGCMRAVLECWAQDQLAGSHRCRDAMQRRIAAGRSTHAAATDTWRESIVQPLYYLTVNHYLGNGEAIREMGVLAGSLFLLYWPGFTGAATLNSELGAFSGNAAHIDRVLGGPAGDPHYAATPRVALVIEQAWMQHNPARHADFLTALGRYADCLQAAADLDMGMVMGHVPALLTLPPASPPPTAQFMLALLAAHQVPLIPPLPAVLPPHIDFLRSLLGAGPTFPSALNINTVLGGLCAEEDILAAIGRPLGGPAAAVGGRPPPPAANIDTVRDAASRNEFFVTPLRRNGVVATVRDDLMVRSTPTTGTHANIFGHLPTGTPVFVIGRYSADWYAIEQPGRTGFVAARYIVLLP
jgi:hypothetical protein